MSLGAHALGALEPDEALFVDEHLATCEECGAELSELSGVSAFLAKVSERDVELVVSPPREVLDRMLGARARRHRRGRVFLAVAASVAIMAVGGTVWSVSQQVTGGSATELSAPQEAPAAARDSKEKTLQDDASAAASAEAAPTPARRKSASPAPMVAQEPAGFAAVGKSASGKVKATVTTIPGRPESTITVVSTGIPVGTTCRLVVIGPDGRRDTAATWTVSRDTDRDNQAFDGKTSIPADAIVEFAIVDSTGETLVTATPTR